MFGGSLVCIDLCISGVVMCCCVCEVWLCVSFLSEDASLSTSWRRAREIVVKFVGMYVGM